MKFKKIGVNDIFGQSGKPEELLEEYGLSENQIYRRLKEVAETWDDIVRTSSLW